MMELSVPMPPGIASLPVDSRGYPVPWFVAKLNGQPDFRLADAAKRDLAVAKSLCWVCGLPLLELHVAFVAGPMCGVNRTSSEPPSHVECAHYSAKVCPFLITPTRTRNEHDLPTEEQGRSDLPGLTIRRNPGVALVWVTTMPLAKGGWTTFDDGNGGILFNIGNPTSWHWYREGRPATRDEVMYSVETGIPALAELAVSAEEQEHLAQELRFFRKYLPPALPVTP